LTGGGGGAFVAAGKPTFFPLSLSKRNASGVESGESCVDDGDGFVGTAGAAAANLKPPGGGSSSGTGVDDDEGGFDGGLLMNAVGAGGGDRFLRADCPAGGADSANTGDSARGGARESKALGGGDKPFVEKAACDDAALLSDGARGDFPGGGGGTTKLSLMGVTAPK
jgi:hypothetical protein